MGHDTKTSPTCWALARVQRKRSRTQGAPKDRRRLEVRKRWEILATAWVVDPTVKRPGRTVPGPGREVWKAHPTSRSIDARL